MASTDSTNSSIILLTILLANFGFVHMQLSCDDGLKDIFKSLDRDFGAKVLHTETLVFICQHIILYNYVMDATEIAAPLDNSLAIDDDITTSLCQLWFEVCY